ncbi:MAG: glutamine amidotransferase-related protein [Myxococcales bacterium]|jgi:GMP synthase (glutamine-hydrolysing)
MKTSRLLLALPGSLPARLRGESGDFDGWFARALAGLPVELTAARIDGGGPLPDGEHDGIIVTGSLASLAAPEPWMDQAAAWLRRRVESGAAVLGVCFGHQLLGYAFGAAVVRNPRGPEFGTVEIELTPEGLEDPLFRGMGPRFKVQQTHEDALAGAAGGALMLAASEKTRVQALAFGPRARGVQFHPEMSEEEARRLCAGRPHEPVREAPAGRKVLENFVRRIVRGERA